jgi:exodeoxyribonuclease VII small subunit
MEKFSPASSLPDIAGLSFEQAMQELEVIVRRLEAGDNALEASLSDYARGTALRGYCAKLLADAKMKVETLIKQSDGGVATAPFDT